MHFDILVEDVSGKALLNNVLPRILDAADTFVVHAYRGIGRVPPGMRDPKEASRRLLLENLPKLLRGYGKTQAGHGVSYPSVVIVVCDLDRRCLKEFRGELYGVLEACDPKPRAQFCIAVEEGEAWLLGDPKAVRQAYPQAKAAVLDSYANDSICGTWEKLADAVYPGGASALEKKGWQAAGLEKTKWAESIAPAMDVETNRSPSFVYFRDKLRQFSSSAGRSGSAAR